MIYNSLPHHTMWIFSLFLFSFFYLHFWHFWNGFENHFHFFSFHTFIGIDRLTFTYFSFYQFFLQIFIKALFANKNLFACFQNHMHACNLYIPIFKLRLKKNKLTLHECSFFYIVRDSFKAFLLDQKKI